MKQNVYKGGSRRGGKKVTRVLYSGIVFKWLGRKRVVGGINKAPFSQGYGFSSTHVWMQELEYKES